MNSSNEDNNIISFTYKNSDLKKLIMFIQRNKYLILFCYLVALIPSYFIANSISTPKRSLGQVNIYFDNNIPNNSLNTDQNLFYENIFSTDLYEELKIVKNEETFYDLFKEINTKNNYKYNEFKKRLVLRLLVDGEKMRINVQYRDFNEDNIKKVLELIIDKYTIISKENRKLKKLAVIKKLDFEINESRMKQYSQIDFITKNLINSDSDTDFVQYIDYLKKLSSEDRISLLEKKFILETTPDNYFEYIKYDQIIPFKTYKIKTFSIIYISFIILILLIVFLKEQYYGPYKSKKLIEEFLQLQFIGDLSSQNPYTYEEVLFLSNKKTDSKLFNNSILIVPFGQNSFTEIEKLKSKISEFSNLNVKISNNIYESNETEKVVIIKNNNSISLNELKKLKERIRYLDKEVLGWFIVN